MTEEFENQLTTLKSLVLTYEYEKRELNSIPKSQIDYFGYACLSNSLMFKEPPIPKYHQRSISKSLQEKTFNTLSSLINYIKSLKNDIDKLFAIFSWEAQNIRYDVDALLAGEEKDNSLDIIFENRCAVDEGYCLFFCELAKKVEIDDRQIKIKKYYSYSKAFGFDPLNIPETIEPDHCAILIEINFIPYVCEPSWAAGHLNSENKFEWNYRPDLFLIPLVKTVCDRMPTNEALIPFQFSYLDFFKACRVSPVGLCLKTESNPFVKFESQDGYVSQIYSCIAPINWVQIHLHKQDECNQDVFTEIPNDAITSYEVVQEMIPNHSERCRFRTNIAFQEEGFYRVEIYIDSPLIISYFVDIQSKSEMPVPLSYNPFHESKFIPIKPSRILSKVRHGVALLRFAVSIHKSDILWNIIKLDDDNSLDDENGQTIDRRYGKFIKLQIPFDDTRYEDQLCITFPSNGRYSIHIYLSNDSGSYTSYAKYFVDVEGAELNKSDFVYSPVEFLYAGRNFSAMSITDSTNKPIKITPDKTCHIINNESQLEQTIELETEAENPDILLEFREDKEVIALPTLENHEDNKFKYKWSIPNKEAEYKLYCWMNDTFMFAIPYNYRKAPLKEQTQDESEILDSLKLKVALDCQYVQSKEENDQKTQSAKNSSSKCCLLI